jgi:hypothetical protein
MWRPKLSQKLTLAAGLAVFAVILVPHSHHAFRIVFIEFWVVMAVVALYLYFVKGK